MTLVAAALLAAVQAYALLYLLYLWVPALAAWAGARRDDGGLSQQPAGERRFAILVSAHNEEAVIASLLQSLAQQHYPAAQRRVFVVANECSDRTAEVVRASGQAVCAERAGDGPATKGAALAWLWARIGPEAADCDCVLVMDADNLVAPDFLSELNRVFAAGYRVAQSARRAKNPDDSWTSQLDAISESLWNRLDQAGRMRLGLSAIIAGSGMAFERDVFAWLVEAGGPGLLEDIEWQARLMLAGIRVGYAARAAVYDEKTGRADQLGRQRKRWVAGLAIAARHYGGRLLVAGVRGRNGHQLVAAFGTSKPPRSLLVVLLALLALGGWLVPGLPGLLPWTCWAAALGSLGGYVLLGMALDHTRPAAYRALLFAPVFVAVMVGASALGTLLASRQQWAATAHHRGITIDQIMDGRA